MHSPHTLISSALGVKSVWHTRERDPQSRLTPIAPISCVAHTRLRWLKDFYLLGLRDAIRPEEVYATNEPTLAKPVSEKFEEWWDEELTRAKPSLVRMLIRKYGWSVVFVSLAFSMTETLMRLLQPIALGGLVAYFAPGQTAHTKQDAYLYAFGIIGTSAFAVFAFHTFVLWIYETGAQVRVGCMGLMYRKSLSLKKSAMAEGLNGQMINILSNELSRFDYTLCFLYDCWKGPLELLLFGYFIYQQIGVAAFAGIAFITLFVPLQSKLYFF